MLRSIIRSSLKSRLIVIAATLVVLIIGAGRLRNMPVDVLPEFSLPYVEIQTESLGLSAEEVEQLITLGMEHDLLNGVPWVRTIRSESVAGLSSIVLVFEPGIDIMRARQMVSERMTQAVALPHVSKPPTMLQPLSATSRVMVVGLSSKTLSEIQMSVLARWTIAPRLMGVPGVANVAVWGQRDRQLQVQVDPIRLRDRAVSLSRVLETTGNALWVSSLSFVEASTPGTGGFIDTDNQRLGIRHILPIVSAAGLSLVPIEGSPHHLGDVASVVEDHQPLIGDALTRYGPGLLLVIEKSPGANTLEVTRGVETALAELRAGLGGVEVDPTLFRPADFIEAAVRNIGFALFLGFLLVALGIAIFFGGWRPTVIALLSILLSLFAAAFLLCLTGTTMSTIAMTGLLVALGVVFSHAIVDVGNITRRLRQSREQGSADSVMEVLSNSMVESRGAMIYAALIVVLAVTPILFAEGISGVFYRPMAIACGLAAAAAFLVSLTVTPALAALLLEGPRAMPRLSPVVAVLQGLYERSLRGLVRKRGLALAGGCMLALAGMALLPSLDRSLMPWFKERDLVVDLQCVPGTSQPEMSRIVGRVCTELRSIPGVRNVGAHIGRAVRGDRVVDVNSATVLVKMEPEVSYSRTAAAIQDVVDGYPGVHHTVSTYLRDKSSDVIPEPEDEVVVRIYGDEIGVLRTQALAVTRAVAGIPNIGDAKIIAPVQQPTLEIEVDLAAAQRRGLKPGNVRRSAAALLSGIQVGSLFEEQKVFDVVVWSTPATRQNLSNVRNLLIDTPDGGHVRLEEIAKVRIVPTASVIRHEAVKRYIDVIVGVEGRDREAVAVDIEARLRKIPFALEYHAAVLRGQETPEVVGSRLLIFGLAAALGMLFLLQAAFGSWRLVGLALLSLPASLVGGVLAAAVTGNSLSLGTLAGLLAVFGVATCGTVMLIAQYQCLQRLEPFEGGSPGASLAVRGACEQFPTSLLVIVTTGLALAPTLFLGDLPGLEVARPMAIALLGGLVTTAVANLFIMPALFLGLGVGAGASADPFADEAGTSGGAPGIFPGAPAGPRKERA